MMPTLRFGHFTLDIPSRTLRYDTQPVVLTPKEFDLLEILVRMHGRLVSKGHLVEHAWSDAMSDAAIFQAVYRLRRTLARYDGGNEYVATVPGRGYQFVAPVVVEEYAASSYDVSGDAFAAYSRAMFQFHHRTKTSFAAAIALFRRAIRLDPQFALAYVGLAHSYLCAGMQAYAEQASSHDQALEACRAALEIDPRCADAYAVLSEIHAFFEADIDAAQRTIETAVSLDRNSWRVRTAAFWAYLTANDMDRALRHVSEALASDPTSNHFTTLLGVGLYHKRRFDEAHARLIDAHLFKPADSMALFYDACALTAWATTMERKRVWRKERRSIKMREAIRWRFISKRAEATAPKHFDYWISCGRRFPWTMWGSRSLLLLLGSSPKRRFMHARRLHQSKWAAILFGSIRCSSRFAITSD